MENLTALLIDDEKLALSRMANVLNLFPHVRIVSKELEPEEAIAKIIRTKPDIVFLDVEMPNMTGFKLIENVRNQFVFPTFIFVTAYNQYAIKALKAEAFDYLIKPIDIDDLRECLERYDHKINHFPHIENSCLSEREKEIARLLCKGKTSLEIANILFLSKHTVDTHRRRILKKTGVESTSKLKSARQ